MDSVTIFFIKTSNNAKNNGVKFKQKRGNVMKATLDRSGCISCGLCAETCPEVFRMADDGVAEVWQEKVPGEAEDRAVEAGEGCPVSVITVE